MATATASALGVGLGELQVTSSGELVAYSLGSCVAICLYDPVTRVAAMAHVVLPESRTPGSDALPGKFADTAVPAMLDELARRKAVRSRLQCRLAGGAAVLALSGGGSLPNIGKRNVEAVHAALARVRLPVLAEATGGNCGRTVRFDAATGRVLVRMVGGQEFEL